VVVAVVVPMVVIVAVVVPVVPAMVVAVTVVVVVAVTMVVVTVVVVTVVVVTDAPVEEGAPVFSVGARVGDRGLSRGRWRGVRRRGGPERGQAGGHEEAGSGERR
jgi:hypothetical protein